MPFPNSDQANLNGRGPTLPPSTKEDAQVINIALLYLGWTRTELISKCGASGRQYYENVIQSRGPAAARDRIFEVLGEAGADLDRYREEVRRLAALQRKKPE